MKLRPYLNFGGNAGEAFRFYEKHLGGRITAMMTFGQMPGPSTVGPEWQDAVLHASISIGDIEVMASDVPGNFQPMRSAYLCLGVDSVEEAERVYGVLAEGGEIYMPMAETFFALRFAQLRDRFGTLWMIIHERPMPKQD